MYEAKNFERLLGTEGFSDVLLRNHFTLYEGYVSNTNKATEYLKTSEAGTQQWSETKRRLGGMRLHELYFGNMAKEKKTLDKKNNFAKKIATEFGSVEAWEKDFKATGALRGIGWAVLACDNETGRCFNVWVNEHDTGNLAGASVLLVMDVFEHAFALDFGIKRADYIAAFWNAIDWDVVSLRFAAV
jgi:Fe-Mn family superoxide dismutase